MKVTLGLYLTEFDVSQMAHVLESVPLPEPDEKGRVEVSALGHEYRAFRRVSED